MTRFDDRIYLFSAGHSYAFSSSIGDEEVSEGSEEALNEFKTKTQKRQRNRRKAKRGGEQKNNLEKLFLRAMCTS
jgi:hypothetical protein